MEHVFNSFLSLNGTNSPLSRIGQATWNTSLRAEMWMGIEISDWQTDDDNLVLITSFIKLTHTQAGLYVGLDSLMYQLG